MTLTQKWILPFLYALLAKHSQIDYSMLPTFVLVDCNLYFDIMSPILCLLTAATVPTAILSQFSNFFHNRILLWSIWCDIGTKWTSGLATTSLTELTPVILAYKTAYSTWDDRSGLQCPNWSVSAVPSGRKPTYYHRPPTTSIVRRCYVWVSKNSLSLGDYHSLAVLLVLLDQVYGTICLSTIRDSILTLLELRR